MLRNILSSLIRSLVKNTDLPYRNTDNIVFLASWTTTVSLIAMYLANYDELIVWLDSLGLELLGLVFLAAMVWVCWRVLVFWEHVGYLTRLRLSNADELNTLRRFMQEERS